MPTGWRRAASTNRWRSRASSCSANSGAAAATSRRSDVHAPSLVGLYGRIVHLMDGTSVVADRQYIMDSILLPKKQVVAGYPPIMPSFAGQISEEDLMKLLAYIESLSAGTR